MMGDISTFAFTISLAAVINGLGIVRLLTTLAEYLRVRDKFKVTHYWVYELLLLFQFLLHVLLWWSMFGTREAGAFNFLGYLFLLIGPILLYLATSVLLPEVQDETVDLRAQYFQLARGHFTIMALMFLWGMFLWPVLVGKFAPTAPVLGAYCLCAVVLSFSRSPKAHAILVPAYCLLMVAFIAFFALELGGVAKSVVEGLE